MTHINKAAVRDFVSATMPDGVADAEIDALTEAVIAEWGDLLGDHPGHADPAAWLDEAIPAPEYWELAWAVIA